jgi:hypothetical protein
MPECRSEVVGVVPQPSDGGQGPHRVRGTLNLPEPVALCVER